ncbi:hypothetical protein [Nocardia alba]|uniref:Uncharacterized protein n=1 Tax=Nocardia alba TaxID=225051 RepID=A0A4R1FUP7_9NOCA|nr:hypothetical protein [Nocardia alba]TCJ97544.1 hypothetical protein DFR71_3587 [Nocardia alba]
MNALFIDGHPVLGTIPGPLALASRDGTIWAAGGGRGASAVLRFDADGWRSRPIDAHGLRAVLPIGDEKIVVAGESGYLAIVSAERVERIATDQQGCLYALVDVDASIWVTGDDGFVATLDPRTSELTVRPRFTENHIVGVVVTPENDLMFVAGHELIQLSADGSVRQVFSGHAPLTAAAFAPDGTLAVAGDEGQLSLAAPGGSPIPCDNVPALDLERVLHDPDRDGFLVVGRDGFVGFLGCDGALREFPAVEPPYRLTSILRWGDGHLYGGWTQQGPPYRFSGALYFDGTAAPDTVYLAPRQEFGPPRRRTVGRGGRPVLDVGSGKTMPLAEAALLMPEVSWPDCALDEVVFYDGDVHVVDTTALLDAHAEDGYAVAIRGDLIVEGALDATAGADGYGSLLVVQGDVWAESAMFRYGIGASISGVLEVATVVLCDHGDDGGTLWAGEIRAQVLSYSLYFPIPDAEFDAFLIGDVYGDENFPPERADEVFVSGVLAGGYLDETTAATWLREGRQILRDA